MSDDRAVDQLMLMAIGVGFLGLWAIWPALAVVAFSITLGAAALGLAVLRARRREREREHREGEQ